MKDLQRDIGIKNRTINELNTKVQNLILGTGESGLKNSKSVTRNIGRRGDLDISYSAKTPLKAFGDNRRSSNSSRAAEYGAQRGGYKQESPIMEADERLENTGYLRSLGEQDNIY